MDCGCRIRHHSAAIVGLKTKTNPNSRVPAIHFLVLPRFNRKMLICAIPSRWYRAPLVACRRPRVWTRLWVRLRIRLRLGVWLRLRIRWVWRWLRIWLGLRPVARDQFWIRRLLLFGEFLFCSLNDFQSLSLGTKQQQIINSDPQIGRIVVQIHLGSDHFVGNLISRFGTQSRSIVSEQLLVGFVKLGVRLSDFVVQIDVRTSNGNLPERNPQPDNRDKRLPSIVTIPIHTAQRIVRPIAVQV
jgi:hypothetical protein